MLKKDLQEYRWVRRNIQRMEERLLELESEATRQTTRISRDPKTTRRSRDPMADVVVKIVAVQEDINRQLKHSYELMRQIEQAMEALPPREAYLVRARYVDCKSWEQIAVDMNYSWQHIHRIHAHALQLLAS